MQSSSHTLSFFHQIFATLQKLFPVAETELHYSNPFQLLVAVILSAQTTDKQVNKVTDTLFATIQKPQDVVALGLDALTLSLKAINYYRNKSLYIWKTAQILADREYAPSVISSLCHDLYAQHGYWISDQLDELTKLPGVGVKTAKVVLRCLYHQDVIAVDTHVHRVANRLGIVHTRTPEQTAKEIEHVIPSQFLGQAHHLFVLFGRYHCKAKKPECEKCELSKMCPYFSARSEIKPKNKKRM